MKLFLFGYPGDLGGACTEVWHTIRLWRKFDVDVHLIPTWGYTTNWRQRCDDLGCTTHDAKPETLDRVEGLPGSIVVSFCNAAFLENARRLREFGCKLVWANCMTWLFDAEKAFYRECGPFDGFMFQSEFQRDELESQLTEFGYSSDQGHLIRGAVNFEDWKFRPRPHSRGEAFVIGRAARPDCDKWSSNTWRIYDRIQYPTKRALMLGMDDRTHRKLGAAPNWADCLSPMALPAQDWFRQLHCTLPINGGARENWPRVGLEAMASGVPIVAQNLWGWRDMIVQGETGFLGDCDEELSHYSAMLAYDETLRQRIIRQSRDRLQAELANFDQLRSSWQTLLERLGD